MEAVEESKIKFIMDTDWLIKEPIDFEHKKYVLLGYFKKIDKLLDQNKIYPTFIELSLHLASLQTLVKENAILYTNKDFKSFDDAWEQLLITVAFTYSNSLQFNLKMISKYGHLNIIKIYDL